MSNKQTAPVGAGAMSGTLGSTRRPNYSAITALKSTPERTVYSNGRACGYIEAAGVFRRKFDTKRHILYRLHAIALAEEVLTQIAGVEHLRLIDETGREYWLTLAEVRQYGIAVKDPHFGPQIAVPLRYWRPTRDIETPAEVDTEPAWQQGTLL